MKNLILSILVITIVVSCTKEKVETNNTVAVSKTIEFRIIPAADYNDPYYDNSTAEVRLQVYKQFSDPFSIEMIWDTVIIKQPLKNYMQMPNPNIITKTFNNIKEDKYRIGVGYEKRYYTGNDNYPQYSAMGEPIPYGNVNHLVEFSL